MPLLSPFPYNPETRGTSASITWTSGFIFGSPQREGFQNYKWCDFHFRNELALGLATVKLIDRWCVIGDDREE